MQGRTNILQLDLIRANTDPVDYYADFQSEWANLETIENNRNLFHQKQAAKRISSEVTQTLTLLTSALNVHLNIRQNLTMQSSSMIVSLQTEALQSIPDGVIQQVGKGRIRLPSNFTSTCNRNQTVSLRVCFAFCRSEI